jgi:hypothetical protein
MKVLLVSNQDGNSAWSRAAQQIGMALDHVGVNTAARHYKLNNNPENLDDRYRELTKKDINGCDVCLHVGLPHHFSWDSRFLNVGYFFTETRNYEYSSWPAHINLLDLAIVPSTYAHEAALRSGVKTKVKTCPVPMETKSGNEIESLKKIAEGDYLFYFVGDSSLRKALPLLLRSFYSEFTANEPVNLVIKTNKFNTEPEQLRQEVIRMVEDIQGGLRVSRHFKKPIIITEDYSDQEIVDLHTTCDCLMAPSFGEAWGFTVMDAMGVGNRVITSSTGAFKEYSPITVPSFRTKCFGIDTFPGLMTGHEEWECVDLGAMCNAMRQAYSWGRNKTVTKQESTFETVGNKLKDIISESHKQYIKQRA